MQSHASSNRREHFCSKKEQINSGLCERSQINLKRRLKPCHIFSLLFVLAAFLLPQKSYAETTVACVEGAEPLVLAFGDVTTGCAIDVGTDTDTFEFSGNAGDEIVLNLRTLRNGLDPNMSLRDPTGAEVATSSCGGNSSTSAFTCGFALMHTLESTGTYLVIVGETGLNESGDYNLQLEKLFPAIAPTALAYDVAVTDTLSPGTDIDFFSFTGNVGDEIVLNLRTLRNGLDPNMSLRDPTGAEVATSSCGGNSSTSAFTCGFALMHTLESTGTYLVIVGETGLNESGDYNLQLEKLFPAIAPTALAYDVAVTDTLSPGTDIDFFSFTGNAGDEIVLNLRTLRNGLDPNMSLRDPTGVEVAISSCTGNSSTSAFTCGFALIHTLESTGTYLVIVGEIGLNEAGDYIITLECPNLNCSAFNPAPSVTNPGPQSSAEGDSISLAITATDADTLTYSATGLPVGLSIDPDSGNISGTLGFDTAGSYNVTVSVSDNVNAPVTVSFSWNITEGNRLPTITSPGAQTNSEGDTVSLQIIADDADGELLTYSATGLPGGLGIDPDSGIISGTLGFDTAGTYNVTVSVSDNVNASVTVSFSWDISEGNPPPTITTPGPQTNNEGDTVSLQIIAEDADGEVFTYSATGLPPGLEIAADSGLISGTLNFVSAASYTVTISVDDGVNPVVSAPPFAWTVNDAPPPVPVVSVTEVDFGDVIVDSVAFASFEVSNSGAAPLVVSDVHSNGLPFTALPLLSFTVTPGANSQTVNLQFEPTSETDFNGIITLINNTGSDLVVPVTGRGIATPEPGDINTVDSIEFIDVEELVSVEQIVTVTNTGSGLLTVTDVTSSDPVFEVFTTPGDILPLVLNSIESRNLIVRFTPPTGTADTTILAALNITSDDVDEAIRSVALSGSVVAAKPEAVNNDLLAARVSNDFITAVTCSNVSGEVQFNADSSSANNYKIILMHQNGQMVESASFSASEGVGTANFDGINACGLEDGVIQVLALLDKAGVVLPAFTGIPAAKNTGLLDPPVLGDVPVFTLSSSVVVCGTSRTDTTVRIEGGSRVVSVKLDNVSTDFCLNVPLRLNSQNTLIASALDDLIVPKAIATAPPVQIVQVDLANIVIAEAFSRPLTVDEIDSLVAEGVIDINEAENFNVSMFTVVLTIGSFPVTISQPVVINPSTGSVSYGRSRSGGGVSFSGWSSGGSSGQPSSPRSGGCVSSCYQIVVIKTESGQSIPGVIIIDGRIKTLKEFFQVGLALFNTTGIFNLSDMNASIDVPGGLTPIRAGLGLDVNDINLDGAVDNVQIGDIGPGETGIAQFLVRGDGIGTHRIDVDFDGVITGGGLPISIPVAGSARTTVEVLGPPELRVEVRFPSNPIGPDVIQNQIYTLIVDITNVSDRPALYTSLELFVGGDALLVDENGVAIDDSSIISTPGTIRPGETQSFAFRVKSLVEGEIIACLAVASENIILTVDTGPDGAACNILNTLPANFVPLPADAAPTVIAISPLNGQPSIPLTSSVLATFTPQTACITADTWQNVQTANIDPNDPSKGLKVVSAGLVDAGTFYLEELDWTGKAVKHIPTDLSVVSPPAGGTTIAVLRLGLDDPDPNSQYFLKPDTAYRATISGGVGGVCSVASGLEMQTTFSWTFTTAETCNVLEPPSVSMLEPTHGSIDRPVDQQIILEFTNRNKDTGIDSPARMNTSSFIFNSGDFAASTFGVYANGVETNGEISGGVAVAGVFEFIALDSRLIFTPDAGALSQGDLVHVRLTDRLNDVCANPVQTPPLGVKLFKFDVAEPDLPEQTIFNLSARAKSGKIDIVWAPVTGAEAYNVYRSTTAGGPYSLIAEDHLTDYAVYADFGLTNGVTYFYVVRSVTQGVESLDSNEASATPSARRRSR